MKKIIAILTIIASVSILSSCTEEAVSPTPQGGRPDVPQSQF